MGGEGGEESEAKQACLQRFSMIPVQVFVLALFFAASTAIYTSLRIHVFSSSSTSKGPSFGRAFFIFGDSYADVGNLPSGPSRNSPYGITWPGHPTGRSSDGYVQSDYLATQVFGCPSPTAFANSNVTSLFQGVNFAVGGAALTFGYGAPTIATQVGWFETIVNSRIYSKDFLASSVTLFCVAGNDYGSYRGSLENYVAFAEEVVGLMEQSLRKLYSLGLRNIMVTTLAPLNCLPASTSLTNYTTCSPNATVEDLVYRHNAFVESTLVTLSNDLPGINFILLRQGEALRHIQANAAFFNISQPLKPCCLGFCGSVDRTGNLLYTVCEDPRNYAVWDSVHPTHTAWENVVNLYVNDHSFTTFAPTLQHWTEILS